MLTVETYKSRECEAIAGLPNRVVEMVQAVVFSTTGYPTRVKSDAELWKYLDVMHETRFERDFANLIGGGVTDHEFNLLKQIAALAFQFSVEQFGRNLTSRGSLLRALHVYRHISDIFQGSPARVFEIGPGSGYLGCLFLLNGWGYGSTDIAQAFYLLQNRLWNYATPGRVRELAEESTWDATIPMGTAVHIPWWEFYRLLDRGVPSVDVVTCNHALAEMHPNSLSFTLLLARKMLQGSGIKAFIFEGWGYELLVPRSTTTEQFYKFGFRLVHNDEKITVFVPDDNENSVPSAPIPKRFTRRWFVSGIKKRLGLTTAGSSRYLPPEFKSHNPISQLILSGRDRRSAQSMIGLDQVNGFYKNLLGSDDLLTPDEQFLKVIGKHYY